MTLLDDIAVGEAIKAGERPCPLCEYIAALDDIPTQEALERAAAGTMGLKRLAAVLSKHGSDIGERTIRRHRLERHEA